MNVASRAALLAVRVDTLTLAEWAAVVQRAEATGGLARMPPERRGVRAAVISALLLQVAAARVLGAQVGEIAVARGLHGRPQTSGASLSASHAGVWVIACAARETIGADVEVSGCFATTLPAEFLSFRERLLLRARPALTVPLWTLKEAYFKTLDAPPDHQPSHWPATVSLGGRVQLTSRGWHARHWILDTQHVLSVLSRAPLPPLERMSITALLEASLPG